MEHGDADPASRDGDGPRPTPCWPKGLEEESMSLFWLLLVAAIVLFIIGFVNTAWWLFVIAVVLLLVGLVSGARGGWGRRRGVI